MVNLIRRGVDDKLKINTSDIVGLDHWGERFGVTAGTLKMAANEVGTSIKAIREWLSTNSYIQALD